ncbi:MAG: NAD(P)H-dependent oxidoreductase, partial [Patescibacteria group bacterium]
LYLSMFILHIDSSANTKLSISRAVSQILVDKLEQKHANAEVKHLDLASNPVPFIDDAWIAKEDMSLSQDLVADLLKADIVVMGAPVYNLSIPASLKAYIDQVVVAGKTFQYTQEGPKGLVSPDKKVYIIASSGTDYESLTKFGMNYHKPYLTGILNFVGIQDITILPYSSRNKESISRRIEKAEQDITALLQA